jgi:CRP/FNR family cyclic AMP-dependent transcriptional regulator
MCDQASANPIDRRKPSNIPGVSYEELKGNAASAGRADDATILLAAQNEALRARIGAAAIHVAKLPFLAGRIPVEGEVKPLRLPDLLIEDQAPFRLSRQHFMITRSGGRLIVSDLGSTLGTIVNGQAIGHHFMKDTAPLHRGENHIIAGGSDSPFEFLVSISQ